MKGMKAKRAIGAFMFEIEPLVEFIACSEMELFEAINVEPLPYINSYCVVTG